MANMSNGHLSKAVKHSQFIHLLALPPPPPRHPSRGRHMWSEEKALVTAIFFFTVPLFTVIF